MPETRATVLLHTLGLANSLPHRTLTFTSESDRIEIGRASKRENKNLAPTCHNALFDSRVMSRTHAILRVSLEKKFLYIRDPGSMHGTWLNQTRLPIDEDIELSNGDVLTFGVEVVRGAETFPPLAVRCECQWLETEYAPSGQVYREHTNLDRSNTVAQKQPQTSNTFCVPEDDDDDNEYDDEDANDCEITSHNPVTFDLTGDRSSESDASSVDSESEDSHSVIEVPSPTTSPIQNGGVKDMNPTEAPPMLPELRCQSPAPVEQINERSKNSEQPLATPRMTPPSANYESEDPHGETQYYDECFIHSSDEGSDVDSEDWSLNDEVNDTADDKMLEPFETNVHFSKEMLPSASDSACVGHETTNIEILPHDSLKEVASAGSPPSLPPAKQLPNDILGTWNIPPILSSGSVLEINRLPEIKFTGAPLQQTERSASGISSTSPPRLPPLYQGFDRLGSDADAPFQHGDPSDRFSATVPSHSYTPLPVETTKPTFSPPLDLLSSQSSQISPTHYKDGPFASIKPIASTGSTGVTAVNGSSKSEVLPFMDPLAPMIPRMSCDMIPEPETGKFLPIEQWKTLSTDPEKISLKKRKATEMESEPTEVVRTTESTREKTDLTDQQGTSITAVSVPQMSGEVERPTKRARPSRPTSFRSYATTAILGAVVGAVGTIAALASLPPDYFA
ncbi:hypothetical protein BJX63DRAFT_66665 [Aspergillus granulosus]|uniref:FHA domain-containing protein n=1 Tax=Aspergillus granulosus TaxID=176169 RepID=A0ABR4GWP8_9EURO